MSNTGKPVESTFNKSANYFYMLKADSDARKLVQTHTNLYDTDTFTRGGKNWAYKGLVTVVVADPDASKNGQWRLTQEPSTVEANWVKEGGGGAQDISDLLKPKHAGFGINIIDDEGTLKIKINETIIATITKVEEIVTTEIGKLPKVMFLSQKGVFATYEAFIGSTLGFKQGETCFVINPTPEVSNTCISYVVVRDVVVGTPLAEEDVDKIGDTNIDLSGYLTIAKFDTDFQIKLAASMSDEATPGTIGKFVKDKISEIVIPAAVQSDMAVTDEGNPAYIKNKPTFVEIWLTDMTTNVTN